MSRWQKSVFAATGAVAVCLTIVARVSARETALRNHDLARDTQLVALQVSTSLRSELQTHLVALGQMAAFFENSREVTEDEFYRYAATMVGRTPLCHRIPVVDASLRVRWVYPPREHRSLVGFDVRTHAEGHAIHLRAIETRQPVLSPPLNLVGGDQGFILVAPIFRNGRYEGSAVCSFRSADFFAAVLLRQVLDLYDVSVFDSGTRVFAGGAAASDRAEAAPAVESFSLGGRLWELRLRPSDLLMQTHLDPGRTAFWVVGGLLALLVGGLTGAVTFWYSWIKVRLLSQGEALEATRARLDGAMQRLVQAEKMTALGELVAGVAHEINNPLSAITGYSQLLLARELPEEVRRTRLETICAEAGRMAKIVRNLLTFARQHPPEKKRLGLNGVIEKTLDLKTYHFRVNQITVEKQLDPDLPMTMLDFHQLQQVFLNLFNNAEDAVQETGRRGAIRVTTSIVGGRIEARVADDGPGIPVDIQGRIFEPFFTTKREGKGTGLGLSLCYGIVGEHGGTIRVESQPGKGTIFIIDLPIVEETTVAAGPKPAPGRAVAPAGLRILVIDDEQSIQDFLMDLLTLRGHRVDTASDVPEALRKIVSNGHDLIISDMKMPGGTGQDIYRAILEKKPHLARRIIFSTGDGASAGTRQFLNETGNVIVFKPYRVEDIERAIAETCRN